MKCPHCTINFHENWSELWFFRGRDELRNCYAASGEDYWRYRSAVCPECKSTSIQVSRANSNNTALTEWYQIHPAGSNRGPVPQEVPSDIAVDYKEACNVLPISAKASAALARRCLQNILHTHGYKGKNLSIEIDLLLNETDPKKAIPHNLRETIDAIRHFGNFSAHPTNDQVLSQVIAVEPHEAEWCLEIIESMFEHFYVAPAATRAKKAALDAKLAAAGKPASK